MKRLLWISCLITCLLQAPLLSALEGAPSPRPGLDIEALRFLAIQEGGRKKPLDTFAREAARFVTGREKFAGFDPLELLFSWLTESKTWETLPILDAGFVPLQKQVRLEVKEGRVSPLKLRDNQDFQLFVQGVAAKQEAGAKLTELEKHGSALLQRLQLFYGISSGSVLTLVPRNGNWESLGRLGERYPDLAAMQKDASPDAKIAAAVQGTLSAYFQNEPEVFKQMGSVLVETLRRQGEAIGQHPSAATLKREVHFNRFKPFRWAWVGYATAFFILLSSLWLKGYRLYWVGMGVLLGVLLLHAYGFYLRCMIAGRPPVTNMYETVIWVSLGIVVFAAVFELIYRAKYFAAAGTALATIFLILADSATAVLDPTIEPLVPVLRSNYWLTIHVLTITLSYAAFALALGVGHVSLGYYSFKPEAVERINRLNYFLYRSIQVGVVLLAAGTILGGVWANASWGRFWGWDPKEVWALIALLGYLSILHGRYAGWLGGFGLAVGSICAFLLVVMAWYGVNFILGVGLHSYGFSSGGAKFMSVFISAELLWVGLAIFRYKVWPKSPALKESSA